MPKNGNPVIGMGLRPKKLIGKVVKKEHPGAKVDAQRVLVIGKLVGREVDVLNGPQELLQKFRPRKLGAKPDKATTIGVEAQCGKRQP